MKSIHEYRQINEGTEHANRYKAIVAIVDALKSAFKDFDMDARREAWKHLTTTEKGKELTKRLLTNPKTSTPNSVFAQLIDKNK